MTKISLITVTYNSEKYLESTFQSVINQKYNDIEYIIIDGGSSDGTVDLIKQYEEYIDYWVSEEDGGMYHAMNKGISVASGGIIGIINSDDWLEEDAVKKVVNASKQVSGKEFVIHGKIAKYDEQDNFVGTHAPKQIPFYYLFSTPFKHPATFISKSVYEKVGLYDESCGLAADYDLMLRIVGQNFASVFIDDVLTNVRLVGISTGGNSKASSKELLKILKRNTGSWFLALAGIAGRKLNKLFSF